jgi:hypothetical protein
MSRYDRDAVLRWLVENQHESEGSLREAKILLHICLFEIDRMRQLCNLASEMVDICRKDQELVGLPDEEKVRILQAAMQDFIRNHPWLIHTVEEFQRTDKMKGFRLL